MSHSDAIVDGNGVELCCKASHFFNLTLYKLTDFMQVDVRPGNEPCKRIDYSDNGLSHLFLLHAIGRPQSPGACHGRPCVLNELRNRCFILILLSMKAFLTVMRKAF